MNLNDPNFFIPAAILGILGTSIFLMRKGHKTMAAVSLVSAFIAVLAIVIGFFVTVGIPEAATTIQNNHRSAECPSAACGGA